MICRKARTISTAYTEITGKPLVRFRSLTNKKLIDEDGNKFSIKLLKKGVKVCG